MKIFDFLSLSLFSLKIIEANKIKAREREYCSIESDAIYDKQTTAYYSRLFLKHSTKS